MIMVRQYEAHKVAGILTVSAYCPSFISGQAGPRNLAVSCCNTTPACESEGRCWEAHCAWARSLSKGQRSSKHFGSSPSSDQFSGKDDDQQSARPPTSLHRSFDTLREWQGTKTNGWNNHLPSHEAFCSTSSFKARFCRRPQLGAKQTCSSHTML